MIKKNVSLKELSNYKIGGRAKYYFTVKNIKDYTKGIDEWKKLCRNLPEDCQKIFILSSGTNLLIDDRGFNGLVIHNQIEFINNHTANKIEFGSGLLMNKACDYCINKSLSGFEWSGGLPGSIGGAIRGNAGAFGGEIKDNLESVKSINLDSCDIIIRNNPDCLFGYRTSIFKTNRAGKELILSAVFKFSTGDQNKIRSATKDNIDYRVSHQPLDYPSAGSTFKNVPCSEAPRKLVENYQNSIKNDPFPVIPVARLLSDAGLKGVQMGEAQFSEKHPNFIINLKQAKSNDVLALIDLARKTLKEKFDVEIESEIMYLEY